MSKFGVRLIVLLLSLVSLQSYASGCYPAKHLDVPNITGETYHQARKLLLANNWQPIRTLHINSAQDALMGGNGSIFWEQGYTEVESCAGTGTAPCLFKFKDIYGNILKIITEGEEDIEGTYNAYVSSYGFQCIKNKK